MVHWTKALLETLGAKVELADVGEQKTADGTKLKLPDVILATYGTDKAKKTVLVYGHLDVQPAQVSDGWDTEPFVLTEKKGKLFGRGSTDDKGPVLSWLNVIEAYQKLNEPFPVNVKFVLESMEEYGSDGLEDLLKSLKNTFLSDVDYVVISDSYWLGKEKPCLQYGLRYARIIFYVELFYILLLEEFVISFWMLNVQQKIYIQDVLVEQCKFVKNRIQ
jgi:nonspecific dipeptidase